LTKANRGKIHPNVSGINFSSVVHLEPKRDLFGIHLPPIEIEPSQVVAEATGLASEVAAKASSVADKATSAAAEQASRVAVKASSVVADVSSKVSSDASEHINASRTQDWHQLPYA
jgi:hypothetical protein